MGPSLRNKPRLRPGFSIGVRNEPTHMLFLQPHQRVQGFVESALVSGLVAEKQREAFLIDTFRVETVVLKAEGALCQPPGLGDLVNQQLFGWISGLMLGEQGGKERFESGGIFAGMMSRGEARPCFRELPDEANFPATVRGPVECPAFPRLISARVIDSGIGIAGLAIPTGALRSSSLDEKTKPLPAMWAGFFALRSAARRSVRA